MTNYYFLLTFFACVASCVVHTTHMSRTFGSYLRERREALQLIDRRAYSLRRVAEQVGLEPSYLSKIERDEQPPPGEAAIAKLAEALGEDADLLLALAGKVSADLLETIRRRPQLFGQLLRELKDLPDHAIARVVREVRDGDW